MEWKRHLITMGRTIGNVGYSCAYHLTRPAQARAFIRTVANAIVDFHPGTQPRLRSARLEEFCPAVDDQEMTVRLSRQCTGDELPLGEWLCVVRLVHALTPAKACEIGTY